MEFRLRVMTLALMLGTSSIALAQKESSKPPGEMDKLYRDESHCLTAPEVRGDKDLPISCFCRDAIADARYVYFTYLLSGKDPNLSGVYFTLVGKIGETCGRGYDALSAEEDKDWKWNGPEVVRTYPPDDAIERITPEVRGGRAVGRWVPLTVQLVYRDAQGRVSRTENYSSREFIPVFGPTKPPPRKDR